MKNFDKLNLRRRRDGICEINRKNIFNYQLKKLK